MRDGSALFVNVTGKQLFPGPRPVELAHVVPADITRPADVDALAAAVDALDGPLTLLVNNAGGARGTEPVEAARIDDWQWMFEVNVLGTVRVTQALLPALERSGAGTVVVLGSTAGLIVYEGAW